MSLRYLAIVAAVQTPTALIAHWPAHLILIYLAAPLAAWMLRKSWPEFAPVIMALAVAGAVEFGVTALADGVETARQLIVHCIVRGLEVSRVDSGEMHDAPAIMCQHKKHIQDLEPDPLMSRS